MFNALFRTRSASRSIARHPVGVIAMLSAAVLLVGAAAPMLVLRYHDLHPDRLYQPYMSGPILSDSTTLPPETIQSFRDLLAQYTLRQGIDDNFTIRVTDNRSGELLELFVLDDLRRQYEENGSADWPEIDRQRRRDMRRLVREHAATGIPRGAISVRWGRKNQIREARRGGDRGRAGLLAHHGRPRRQRLRTPPRRRRATVETRSLDAHDSPGVATHLRGDSLSRRMTFQPGSELSQEEVTDRVDSAIADNDVVLFIKGNRLMPQCGYSKRALELVGQYQEEFETVDTLEALEEYRTALEAHSGRETIPQTYVDGEFVGGSDILAELDERGELEATLTGE